MKMNVTPLLLFFLVLFSHLQAQHTGDYRSAADITGEWNEPRNWEVYTGSSWVRAAKSPTHEDGVITISQGDSIRLTNSVSIDQVIIEPGGILSVYNLTDSIWVTLNDQPGDDILVKGKLYLSYNATLQGSGMIHVQEGGQMVFRRRGTLAATTLIEPQAFLEIDQDPCLQSQLTNNGTINWTNTGNLRMINGTLINNGTFNILSPAKMFITNDLGTNAFINSSSGIIFKANPEGSLNINAPFTNNGIIKGRGTFSLNNTTGGGTFAPGDPLGVLTVNPRTFLSLRPTIEIEIGDGSGAGTGNDQLQITENRITDLSSVALAVIDHHDAHLGTYTIITTSGSFSGSFRSISLPANYDHLTIQTQSITVEKMTYSTPDFKWGEFSASTDNNFQAVLKWSTLQENRIAYFVIERSSDSLLFQPAGRVNAKGPSTSVTDYSFTDATPDISGTNYYRLKVVTNDGRTAYSVVRQLKFNLSDPVRFHPNPATTQVRFSSGISNASISIISMNGAVVKNILLHQGTQLIDITALPAGVYLVAIYQEAKFLQTKRLVKL